MDYPIKGITPVFTSSKTFSSEFNPIDPSAPCTVFEATPKQFRVDYVSKWQISLSYPITSKISYYVKN